MTDVDFIKLIFSRCPHEPSRLPHIYHHDYIRGSIEASCTRAQVAAKVEKEGIEEEKLYASALVQYMDGGGWRYVFEALGSDHFPDKGEALCRVTQIMSAASYHRYNFAQDLDESGL